jgi:lysophospholipase L1-like esterase
VSGTTLDNVQSLLDKSDNEVEADFVKKVVLPLGTNDISKHKNDVEQVNVNFTMCIKATKQKYHFSKIGIYSILPRRGKGMHLQALNAAATSVNTFARKLCKRTTNLQYIDLWTDCIPNGVPNRGMYDLNDPSGVHIKSAGPKFLGEIFADFASSVSDNEYQTSQSKKKLRSYTSTPGSEVKQQSTIPKPSTW